MQDRSAQERVALMYPTRRRDVTPLRSHRVKLTRLETFLEDRRRFKRHASFRCTSMRISVGRTMTFLLRAGAWSIL